jgi:hypothetical protein
LRLVLDSILGPTNFQNEIIWKRSSAHSDTTQGATHLGRTHDTILFYGKGPTPRRNIVTVPFDKDYVESHYRSKEPRTGRRFRLGDLTAAKPGGDTLYEWIGPSGKAVRPYPGRYWAYSKDKMADFEREGRLVWKLSQSIPSLVFRGQMRGNQVAGPNDLCPDQDSSIGVPIGKSFPLGDKLASALSSGWSGVSWTLFELCWPVPRGARQCLI